MRSMNKVRIPRWLRIIAAVYAIYIALVIMVATPLVNVLAPRIYQQQTGAQLTLGKIAWINPFTLTISLRAMSSTLRDTIRSNPFWSFDALDIDLSLASVWRGHLVLDRLALQGADVHIVQLASNRFNFSDVLDYRASQFPPSPAETEASSQAQPLEVEITQLEIHAKQLHYRAPNAAEPIDAAFEELSIKLGDVSTLPTPYASDSRSTQILRGGDVFAQVKTAQVAVARNQLPFKTALRDIQFKLPAFDSQQNSAFELSMRDSNEGHLHVAGNLDLAHSNIDGHAVVQALNLLPAWQWLAPKLAFDLSNAPASAQLDGEANYSANWTQTSPALRTHSLRYRVADAKFVLRNLHMQSRSDKTTAVDIKSLQLVNLALDSEQQVHIGQILLDEPGIAGWNTAERVSLMDMFAFSSEETSDEPSPWQIHIDEFAVRNGSVRWHASQIDHLPLALTPLEIRVSDIHWPSATPIQIDLSATLNATTQVNVKGALSADNFSGELRTDIRNLPLQWGDPFLREQMQASISDGILHARTTVVFDRAQPTRVRSEGSIERFELRPLNSAQAIDSRKLATWQQLQWQQLQIDIAKQQLTIKHLALAQPWLQFRINADGTNNFQQLLKTSDATSTSTSTPTPTSTFKSTSASGLQPPKQPWHAAIDSVQIDRAAIDFRDASLASAFRTNITELSGTISQLDTRTGLAKAEAAKVALKGTVDGYAPVAITGTFNLFTPQPALNITLDINNLDLATLTPYAGTYAGYQIDGGRLSVQMAYTLEDERIKGSNHIVVNQMQLGKQVSGPKVMDLPLRFAIYLLTDSKGVMDLGVDVTGNVDDPDFSVGSIIWKAFRNLIVKTATSPFRALARIAGGDRDDLDRIEFQPGSSNIVTTENQKLESLQRALEQKTALQLNIMGHVSPSRDIEALRDNVLSAQLIDGGISTADIQTQSKNWQREVVELFKKRFPDEKAPLQVMQMNDAMRDNMELMPNALQELAGSRALAVKQILVAEHGLAADRVFVKPTDLGTDQNLGAIATMSVE